MEAAANLFTDGLNTDVHPLTTLNILLTDALNATFRTFNGHECILLNDMGNTLILDSTTGNIMGLRDGFIPVGMKEYGGILYIASLNPITKENELGTIPSPVILYTYPALAYKCNMSDSKLTNIDTDENPSTSLIKYLYPKYLNLKFQISDNRFLVGDLFIASLTFDGINTITTRPHCNFGTSFILSGTNEPNIQSREFLFLTGFLYDPTTKLDIPNYGWFKVVLEAKIEKSDETVNLDYITQIRQRFYLETDPDILESNYWFINDQNNLILDTDRCLADELYRTYPNILPGYLYVHLEPELPDNYQFFINKSTLVKSPIVYVITETN